MLLKINAALISISLTQCHMKDMNDMVDIHETQRMHQFHFVQKGETLKEIAQKYHMSIQELSHINQMSPKASLYKGQRLHVHKRDFDHHEMIPLVKETDKKNAYTDYNVDQQRTKKSEDSDKKLRKYLLLPFVGIGALGAGIWSLVRKASNVKPNIKVDGASIPTGDMPSTNSTVNPKNMNIDADNPLNNEIPKAAVGTKEPHKAHTKGGLKGPNGETIEELEDLGFDLFKTGVGLLGGSTTLGLGLAGLNKLLQQNDHKDKIAHASLDDYCARIAFGWPLNYKKRVFRYVDPGYKEAGILIANSERELYITPAFPGQIIDIQKPSRSQDRYTIVIKHRCNNLTTIYGNIRIPSEAKDNPEKLIGLYVTKTDAIGLIDPDKELFFCVKQLQAGKDAPNINYEFQQIAKHTARLLRHSHEHGQKIDIGGLSFGVLSPTRDCKILTINKQQVSKIYFLDPLKYLPKHPLS